MTNGNIGISSPRKEGSVSWVVDEGVSVVIHINSESIPEGNDVTVSGKFELHRELYELCFT